MGRDSPGAVGWLRKSGRRQLSNDVDGPWCVQEIPALADSAMAKVDALSADAKALQDHTTGKAASPNP
ncbi:MAG: hypothetical protein HEQ38_01875 [Gemmatimonas sp.]|nr:hypothetical protein [Gemmatimonas sp.]